MRLLIFVGAASPELPQYRDVYELLQLAAPRCGYTDVDWSVRWEGRGLQPQLCSERGAKTTGGGSGQSGSTEQVL